MVVAELLSNGKVPSWKVTSGLEGSVIVGRVS